MPDGKDEPIHNHNFCATAKVTAAELNDKAMVVDFCTLKQSLDEITEALSQAGNIGRIDFFVKNSQTTEIVAKYIFQKLQNLLPKGVCLASDTVTEAPGSRAEYSE